MSNQKKNVRRVYGRSQIEGKCETPSFYSDGEPLPSELLNCKRDGNADSIQKYLRNGVFYVLFRGHGGLGYWKVPKYQISDFANEKYGVVNLGDRETRYQAYYPPFFDLTCNNGNFNESQCFASESLSQARGGSSAIIAATQESISNVNDFMAKDLTDQLISAMASESLDLDQQESVRIGNLFSNTKKSFMKSDK